MKKNTLIIILVILIVLSIVPTVFACTAMSPVCSAIGGFVTASFCALALISAISDNIVLPFVKHDEGTFQEVYDKYDKEVYIMCNNVVRHRSTGEDLYHGSNFADCKAWCDCHDYIIIDDIW